MSRHRHEKPRQNERAQRCDDNEGVGEHLMVSRQHMHDKMRELEWER